MKATDTQIGGNHYKGYSIQPIEFIHKNKLSFIQGNIIKYVCRYKEKNGVQDLEKAKHYIDLLIEMEGNTFPEEYCCLTASEWIMLGVHLNPVPSNLNTEIYIPRVGSDFHPSDYPGAMWKALDWAMNEYKISAPE